jgi:hypothetical protein
VVARTVERTDLVIVGGGLAGTCAAIAAARLGARVSLVTNRPVLGGNSSSEVRVWVVGATAHGTQRFSRETGIMGELFLENQYRNPEGNPVYWDQVVLDAVRAEPNITLHLNTDVHDVETDGPPLRRIASVSGWNMQTETWTRFEAPVFADCTGDGLIGALAGASFMSGREGRGDYGEEWAPAEPDGEFLGSSMFFYTTDTGTPTRFVAPNIAKDITATPIPRNRLLRTGDNGCDYWWIEWGGQLDIVNDSDRIRDELLGVIYGIWDHIKNSGDFDADTLSLEWVGSIPGRREYRRFLGDHVLTQQDLMDQREFDDAVAFGGWSIDLHPVEGMYAEQVGARQRYANGPYQIPFRSLYSRDIDNLLLAGRDISATHIAEGSARVMATCATEGQAIGTAAAIMARRGIGARALADDAGSLQQLLLKEDASMLGVGREDRDDLLRGAAVRASSHQGSLVSGTGDHTGDERAHATTDLAVILPVDPRLDRVEFLVDATEDTDLTVELWGTDRPQNYVPVDLVGTRVVRVGAGADQWAAVEFGWTPPTSSPCNVVAVVRANPAISLHLTRRYPYGMMMLRRRTPAEEGFDPRIPDEPGQLLTTWIARSERGRVPVLRATPPTLAYEPSRVLDPYQRPWGGPHMWMSALRDAGAPGTDGSPARGEDGIRSGSVAPVGEWLRIDLPEPAEVASVRIVFNDDVDADLVNLHHHRTPWSVVPTLVADYRLEAHEAGAASWTVLADVRGNRHRHAVHDVEPLVIDGLRLTVLSTHGAPYASVSAIKAYAEASGRAASAWR